jgi:acetyl-CoA carboxylase carboxyltransferase component
MDLPDQVEELKRRRAQALAMGGEEAIARQHAREKLTARERIEILCDPGSFSEIGLLAHAHSLHATALPPERTPADGVVTGQGLVSSVAGYRNAASDGLPEATPMRDSENVDDAELMTPSDRD